MRDHPFTRAGVVVSMLVALTLLAGCTATVFCNEDWECKDAELHPGACIDDRRTGRYCAISSFACPSLWRWKYNAEPSLREKCVAPELVPPKDGGADGSPPPPDLAPDAGTDR